MKKFNINDYIYIQIEESGWQHLSMMVGSDYVKNCIESRKVIINGQDWYRLQCHNVFELSPISVGLKPFFKTTIMIDEQFLNEYENENN